MPSQAEYAYAMLYCGDAGLTLVNLETEEEYNNITDYIANVLRKYINQGLEPFLKFITFMEPILIA
jgi:hypothetical protein